MVRSRPSRAILALPASPPEQPADPLSDLVEGFAKALLAKLRLASANGRSGWERDDWEKQCQQGLLRHLEKGDPRDVAAYCAFMWHHDWITLEQPANELNRRSRNATIEDCARVADRWGDGSAVMAAEEIRLLASGMEQFSTRREK